MKKYITGSLLFTLLMVLTSCVDELFVDRNGGLADGEFEVSVIMQGLQSQQTRAHLDGVPENPNAAYLEKLKFYLFVFEDNGSPQANYLRQLVYGEDISAESLGDGTSKVRFRAKLDGTSEKAIIHIVATDDADALEAQLKSVPDRSELGMFAGASGLYTYNHEAYWKRVELGTAITSDDSTLDAIKRKLTDIRLIRNVLRVTLSISDNPSDVKNFVPQAFVVVNAVDKGYIAAYNENLGASDRAGFVDFEKKDASGQPTGEMQSFFTLNRTMKYVPERHPASERLQPDDNYDWIPAFSGPSGDGNPDSNMKPKYLYERSAWDANRTYVIVKGDLNGKTRYIKLEIGDYDRSINDVNVPSYGVFEIFDLIRNISYDIKITHISTTDVGHPSVEGAISSPPSNNISTSVETRPLESIEDGVDKMQVNKTTWVIVDDDDGNPKTEEHEMKWTYSGTRDASTVKWNYPGFDFKFEGGVDPDGVFESWTGSSKTDSHDTPVNDGATNDAINYGDGWYGFDLKFNKPDNITRQKTIRLYQPYGLTRDITFVLHKRWEFVNNATDLYSTNVEVYPGLYNYDDGTMRYETLDEMRRNVEPTSVGGQLGAAMTVMFQLPEDLPEAIFPLDFKIGANRHNIENAHVGNAAVTWGSSLFTDNYEDLGVPRMQFIKTVTWADYQKHKVVTARFLMTTDVTTETTGLTAQTKVRVFNPYFTMGEDDFTRIRSYFAWTNSNLNEYISWSSNMEVTNANGGNNMRVNTGTGHSAENPDFTVNLQLKSNEFKGGFFIEAWANSRNQKNGNVYKIYNRDIFVAVKYKRAGSNTEELSTTLKYDCNATNENDYSKETVHAYNIDLSQFNVPAGATVTQFVVWSKKDDYPYDTSKWDLQDVATNYRRIQLLLGL